MEKFVCFVHIPRTGGNNLIHKIAQSNIPNLTRVGFPGIPARSNLEELLPVEGTIFVHGHAVFGIHQIVDVPVSYAVLLRDPLDRFISEFYWQLRRHPLVNTPEAMLSLFERYTFLFNDANHQTRMLSQPFAERIIHDAHITTFDDQNGPITEAFDAALANIETFSCVGFTEYFDSAVNIFEYIFDAPIYSKIDFRNRPHGVDKYFNSHEIPEIIRDRLREILKYDYKLYNWAVAHRAGLGYSGGLIGGLSA